MTDRLKELLDENRILFGILSRDPTIADMEIIAQAGYHVVWLDMEHTSLSAERATELCRFITHLGMVPLVRIVELARSHVQVLLDGGFQIMLLPGVAKAGQAAEFVRLGKFPPLGQRGISSCSPAIGYSIGADQRGKVEALDGATHLMVQIESDEGLENIESICAVEGIDLVTVGPLDWKFDSQAFGPQADAEMARKVERVFSVASAAGKVTSMVARDEQQAARYALMGVRILFAGVDIALKARAYGEAIAPLQAAARK